MSRLLTAAVLIGLVFGAVACSTSSDDSQPPAGTGTPASTQAITPTMAVSATVIVRIPPTASPTKPPNPLDPVPSEELPGIVVPRGAEMVRFAMATESTDAGADFVVSGIDDDALFEWFREHMPEAGWVEDEQRDGALIFLHEEQLSARYADEELPRTATVFFGTIDDLPEGSGSFTVVAEMPLEAADNAADVQGQSTAESTKSATESTTEPTAEDEKGGATDEG